MPPKKTRLGALLNNRCPKCYEGKLFLAMLTISNA